LRQAPAWADDPAAPYKFDRNAQELPRYAEIERTFERDIHSMIGDFGRGRLDAQSLVREFGRALQEAETEAFVAGRRARKDLRDTITEAEARMLAGRHARNMRYFHQFVRDMEEGAGRMDYMRRGSLYAKSLWSLYNRGEATDWEDPESENARYEWLLDVDAEHCADCIERARLSREKGGFTWDELIEMGFPGERTRCMVNCRCSLRRIRKRTLLPERMEDLSAAPTPEEGAEELERLLGGPGYPVKLPGAGVPYIAVSPEVVQNSLETAGEAARDLGRLLPVVPLTTAKPAHVEEFGPDHRSYFGHGLEVQVSRDENGLWQVFAILLLSVERLMRFLRRAA
jgi:hypothetical protein